MFTPRTPHLLSRVLVSGLRHSRGTSVLPAPHLTAWRSTVESLDSDQPLLSYTLLTPKDSSNLSKSKSESAKSEVAVAATPRKTAYILHGLLGSGKNWIPFTKNLLQQNPLYDFVLVDLRNHGDSAGFSSPHTLQACAHDVLRLADSLNRPMDAVIGHSLGGKVALAMLREPSCESVVGSDGTSVALVDTVPGTWDQSAMDTDKTSVLRILDFVSAMNKLPVFPTQRQVMEFARGKDWGFSDPMARFLAWNVVLDENRHPKWRFCTETASALLRDHLANDMWSTVVSPPPFAKVELIVATESSRWSIPANHKRLDQLRATTTAVPVHEIRSGHWVHVDNPTALEYTLTRFLNPTAFTTFPRAPRKAVVATPTSPPPTMR